MYWDMDREALWIIRRDAIYFLIYYWRDFYFFPTTILTKGHICKKNQESYLEISQQDDLLDRCAIIQNEISECFYIIWMHLAWPSNVCWLPYKRLLPTCYYKSDSFSSLEILSTCMTLHTWNDEIQWIQELVDKTHCHLLDWLSRP